MTSSTFEPDSSGPMERCWWLQGWGWCLNEKEPMAQRAALEAQWVVLVTQWVALVAKQKGSTLLWREREVEMVKRREKIEGKDCWWGRSVAKWLSRKAFVIDNFFTQFILWNACWILLTFFFLLSIKRKCYYLKPEKKMYNFYLSMATS